MNSADLPIAIYYEHPDWFRPLFAEMERRAVAYVPLDASRHSYEVTDRTRKYALVLNRMSASASLRDHRQGIFFTRDYLSYLESIGTRVINGRAAFEIEISKARQLALLHSLGLAAPRSYVINCMAEALKCAGEVGFPLLLKPNIGGRGAGIVRFDSRDELEGAIAAERINLGIDRTTLVQEFIPARAGHIVRVETLERKFLYALKVFATGDNFNLCPAEICQTEGAASCLADGPKAGLKVERYEPPKEVVRTVERIVAAAGIEVGGVEYLVDDHDRVFFYDINALSNFVADATHLLGFDPHARLVDYLLQERGK